MGYFKKMEIERMEKERLQMENERLQRDQDQEPAMAEEQMRLVARKFLVAICDARLSGQEPIRDRMADDFVREKVFEEFNQFSEEDWVEFKKFLQFAL